MDIITADVAFQAVYNRQMAAVIDSFKKAVDATETQAKDTIATVTIDNTLTLESHVSKISASFLLLKVAVSDLKPDYTYNRDHLSDVRRAARDLKRVSHAALRRAKWVDDGARSPGEAQKTRRQLLVFREVTCWVAMLLASLDMVEMAVVTSN